MPGCGRIEAGAFVRPDLVPAMAGTEDVLAGVRDLVDVRLPVLVPNRRGLRSAVDAGAAEIAVFASASETFSQNNVGAEIDETLARLDEVAAKAKSQGLGVRGYVSCIAGCPFEGQVALAEVVRVTEALLGIGCTEISLGDTIGIGTPRHIADILLACSASAGMENLAIHAHDTMGQALANVLTALELGVRVVDSSVAGLGGCPFAPGAAGNLATEDLVYLLDGLGVRHGVDLDCLIRARQGRHGAAGPCRFQQGRCRMAPSFGRSASAGPAQAALHGSMASGIVPKLRLRSYSGSTESGYPSWRSLRSSPTFRPSDPSPLREAIRGSYHEDEDTAVARLLPRVSFTADRRERVTASARAMAERLREDAASSGGVEAFMHAYCAWIRKRAWRSCAWPKPLLRVRDTETADTPDQGQDRATRTGRKTWLSLRQLPDQRFPTYGLMLTGHDC